MNSENTKSRPRPLSPHVQVYSWLITSTLSIVHRLTGVVLSLGLLAISFWLITMAYAPETHAELSGLLRTIYGQIVLVGWSFAMFYHLCNGIRHLFWDMGKGFALTTVTKSGITVIIVATILTVLTWLTGYGVIAI